MDTATAELIKAVVTDAIKIIAPAAIAAYVSYRTVKRQFDIERVRLHEKDKVEALKRLLKFAREMRNGTFPLAEEKRRAFLNIMRSHFFGKLELDYVYFSDEVTKLLDDLEERYICMTRGELIPEMDAKEENEFIEHKLFEVADVLTKTVKKTMRTKGISA